MENNITRINFFLQYLTCIYIIQQKMYYCKQKTWVKARAEEYLSASSGNRISLVIRPDE